MTNSEIWAEKRLAKWLRGDRIALRQEIEIQEDPIAAAAWIVSKSATVSIHLANEIIAAIERKGPKSLGFANTWAEKPKVIKECQHSHKSEPTSMRCVTKYTCEECGFYYFMDSSD